ncbi:MAG TPA: TonB-dependent receptor plug domain-containing protein [Gemmatimonadaceae bacterium]|jgi:outer membrane receptor protein involved in Fe transport|nr:TonB-dependent receptor plug domain-containing protein [Gemmatimonadaceae bacterium]
MFTGIRPAAFRIVPLLVAASAALACVSAGRTSATTPAPGDDAQIGYGELPRTRVTSAITSIFPTHEEAASVGRVEELLIGRAPGVEVLRTATGGYTVRIRGAMVSGGDPLIVVDGVAQSPNVPTELVLSGINPGDIRRIDILRGSSGAAYGLRGGNGVILIERRSKPH